MGGLKLLKNRVEVLLVLARSCVLELFQREVEVGKVGVGEVEV